MTDWKAGANLDPKQNWQDLSQRVEEVSGKCKLADFAELKSSDEGNTVAVTATEASKDRQRAVCDIATVACKNCSKLFCINFDV